MYNMSKLINIDCIKNRFVIKVHFKQFIIFNRIIKKQYSLHIL